MTASTRRDPSSRRASLGAAVLALLLSLSAAVPARAQEREQTLDELIDTFIHFVIVANPELAAASAQAIIDRDPDPAEFLGVIEDTSGLEQRFDQNYRRALLYPELEALAAQLWSLYEDGRRQRARNPDEIDRNIAMLDGTSRQRILAEDRLRQAREYAVPQLLEAILRGESVSQRAMAGDILRRMGREAAVPLSAVLMNLDAASQVRVVRVLGSTASRVAIPYLYELRETTDESFVRDECEDAIRKIDGRVANLSVAALYRELANDYYEDRHAGSLATFQGEKHQLLWDYLPGIGLEPTAIYSELYHEAMAMRLAARSLELDPNDPVALSLWISANISRELDQPEDYDNPAYASDMRDAEYFAVASGSGVLQRALARALRDRDTKIAMRTIDALARIAGTSTIWEGLGDERPLVDALSYPDRRVQYEAALAIAAANPLDSFVDAERVAPILASLVRNAGERFAVVVATDIEDQQDIRAALVDLGYSVLPTVARLEDAAPDIATTPGVDLIVMRQTADLARETIERLVRTSPRLGATPVLALLPAQDVAALRTRFADDHLTRLARRGDLSEPFAENVRLLEIESTGTPLTEDEIRAYSLRALEALEDLAISGNPVISVREATFALEAALDETEGSVRQSVARVLAHVNARRAQRAIMDAALASEGRERVGLLGSVADSAKRFGPLLEDSQILKLREIAESAEDDEATAAAAAIGALGLSGDLVTPLILGG